VDKGILMYVIIGVRGFTVNVECDSVTISGQLQIKKWELAVVFGLVGEFY
jgi:hypothetical protein